MITARRVLACVLALALGSVSTAAHAMMKCSLVNTSGVSFGGYQARDVTAVQSAGLISIECENVRGSDMITIELGRGNTGSFVPRRMMHGSFQLEYNLYLDAARTQVWGDGTSGTSVFTAHPVEGRTLSVPIFGQIPARQNAAPGAYHDQVIVTVLY